MQEIGALWRNEAKSGKVYFSGKMDFDKITSKDDKILMFMDDNKTNPKAPDAKIYLADKREPTQTEQKPKEVKTMPGFNADDVPF